MTTQLSPYNSVVVTTSVCAVCSTISLSLCVVPLRHLKRRMIAITSAVSHARYERVTCTELYDYITSRITQAYNCSHPVDLALLIWLLPARDFAQYLLRLRDVELQRRACV